MPSSSQTAPAPGSEILLGEVSPRVLANRKRTSFILRTAGKLCLLAALGVAAYMSWLLWGTGLTTSRAQTQLKAQILERIERFPPPVPDGNVVPGSVSYRLGEPVAILRIPRIDLDMVVVEGSDRENLKKGPGHYPSTALPWEESGPVAIAGHRTTYGQPFWSLNKLRRGDLIRLVTEFGTFDYRVTRLREVLPSEGWVLEQTDKPTLVLTTCTPRFTANRRLIVFAER